MSSAHGGWPTAIIAALLVLVAADGLAQSSKSAPTIKAPTPPVQSKTSTPRPSAVGTPMIPLAPIAPLSPQTQSTPLAGGPVRADRLGSPSPSSTSPSESAQSIAGG